jgi:hypothetical protein
MTQPSQTYEQLERRASESKHQGPPEVVNTVISAKPTQPDGTAPHTMEHSTKGRGTLIGILVIPGILLLLLLTGYWLVNLFAMNSQQESTVHQERPAAETNAPRPDTPVTP